MVTFFSSVHGVPQRLLKDSERLEISLITEMKVCTKGFGVTNMKRFLLLLAIFVVASSGCSGPKKVKCKFTSKFCRKYGKGYVPVKKSPEDCCPSMCLQQFSSSSVSYNRRLGLRTFDRALRSRRCPKKVKCKFTSKFCRKYGKGYVPVKKSPEDCCPSMCLQQFSSSSVSYNR